MTKKMLLRPMQIEDWSLVAKIYKQGIVTKNLIFKQDVPSWDDWNNGHLKSCRIIAELNNIVVGWAALTPVSG